MEAAPARIYGRGHVSLVLDSRGRSPPAGDAPRSAAVTALPAASLALGYEAWIFALHLLTAATLVGSLVLSWIVVVALRSAATADATLGLHRVATVGWAATAAGLAGTIGFGLWLAILHDDFHPWDGWVIAAIVLWALATVALRRSAAEYRKPVRAARALAARGETGADRELLALNRTASGLVLRALASLAIVLIVVDMIYKPGA
jgi:hypothetical protein